MKRKDFIDEKKDMTRPKEEWKIKGWKGGGLVVTDKYIILCSFSFHSES